MFRSADAPVNSQRSTRGCSGARIPYLRYPERESEYNRVLGRRLHHVSTHEWLRRQAPALYGGTAASTTRNGCLPLPARILNRYTSMNILPGRFVGVFYTSLHLHQHCLSPLCAAVTCRSQRENMERVMARIFQQNRNWGGEHGCEKGAVEGEKLLHASCRTSGLRREYCTAQNTVDNTPSDFPGQCT